MRKSAVFAIACVILAICATAGANSWVSVQLPFDQFGHLVNSGPLCVPTATVNSFQFLQNRYPEIYDSKLIPNGDLAQARYDLAFGWTYNGQQRDGTDDGTPTDPKGAYSQPWWEAKVHWVEDFAPGTTIFDGMIYRDGVDLSTWYGGSVLTNGYPTWEFLWKELSDGEDVEIGIRWDDHGHALTLTSLKFYDANGNAMWDAGEARKIDYLDPNNPTQLFEADLSLGVVNGDLQFTWDNGSNPSADVSLWLAYSESPIPEPLTMLAVGMGIAGLAGYIRKRRLA